MDNQPHQRVVEYFPPASGCMGAQPSLPHPQLRINFELYNTLGVTLRVMDRSGAAFTLPSLATQSKRQLLVTKSYDTIPSVNVDIRDLTDVDVVAGDEELLARQLGNPSTSKLRQRTVVQYTITLSTLRQMGGVLYLPNLDLQVSIADDAETPPHPFSSRGRKQRAAQQLTAARDDSGFHYRIKIIDPNDRFGPRFININGLVYRIPTTVPDPDGILHEGVWVLSSMESAGNIDQRSKEAYCYPFEAAEQALGLYRTKVEAETLGKPEDQYRREQQEFAHRLKLEETELRNRRNEIDNERLVLERQRMEEERVLEHTRREIERERDAQKRWLQEREFRITATEHELKTRSLFHKEEYERRSLERKDSSERWKLLPVVLTVIGGLVMAYQKYK